MLKTVRSRVRDEKGMATLEMIPLLFVFIYVFAYMLGSFGIVHTGIKHSIASRAYAFETFRNRTSLVYFRDIPTSDRYEYRSFGNRFHGVMSEDRGDNEQTFIPSERALRMGIPVGPHASRNDPTIHNDKVHAAPELANGKRNTQVEASPVWIMVQYGICLDVKCGD